MTQRSGDSEIKMDKSSRHYSIEERRTLPRLSLTSEQFRLSRNGKIYSVVDLSEKGMAFLLLDEREIPNFPVGTWIEGTLNLRRVKYQVKARVRNLVGDRIGCEFQEPTEEFRKALVAFLDPAALGKKLKPIPSSESDTLWYHGPSGTDLLLFQNRNHSTSNPGLKSGVQEGRVGALNPDPLSGGVPPLPEGRGLPRLDEETGGGFERFILYVFDSYIQWDQKQGVKTGKIKAAAKKSPCFGVLRLDTLLLEEDHPSDIGKMSIAKTVILSSNLPLDLKNWCVRQLTESRT